jgi:hypothetical protein
MPEDSSPTRWREGISSAPALGDDNACVKHLSADIAARCYLLETLEHSPMPAEDAVRAALLAALAAEIQGELTARKNELHALLSGISRPSTTENHRGDETYSRYGPTLLADTKQTRSLLDVPGDWQTLIQRRALSAEREEILKAEERLVALASEWRDGPREPADDAEVSAGFAHQVAHVLAGKRLLLRTHDRLETGLDAELAIVLLRVWLDYVATRLDEFTILVRDRLRPAFVGSDRPLVEFGSGPPPRTIAEYLAAPSPYTSGDFLLAPVDLLQPRLVPEMMDRPQEITAAADLMRAAADLRDRPGRLSRREETLYLAEALAMEIAGRRVHPQTRRLDLETACARLIVTELRQRGNALSERCVILRELAEEVLPRGQRGGEERVRHLGRDVLELEALKADFRRRAAAAWDVFGAALGCNADVQASCFALAEAAAWLKAADSTLGRMGWLSRLSVIEERDEPVARLALGRRALTHCHAEIRDRLFRFDEDLASLRRGYYAPHVRAADLLRMPEPSCSPSLSPG